MPLPPTPYRRPPSAFDADVKPGSGGAQPRFDYPLGAWEGGGFAFKSPAHEKQWQADSFTQGSHHLLWMKGRRLRPEENALAEMGLPHSDDVILGPDGHRYQGTLASQEDPHLRRLRATYLAQEPITGSAVEAGARAALKAMPKALQWMAQGSRVEANLPAANDNHAAANERALKGSTTAIPETNAKATPMPTPGTNPDLGRLAAGATLNGAHQFISPPSQASAADSGGVHERSKNVATRSQVERFAPTNFEALAKEVDKYEANNPFFTRAGQRLKAGAFDFASGASATVGSLEASSLQRMTPYLDQIDQGDSIYQVLPTLPNGQLDPTLRLTPLDIDFIRRYYGSPEDRTDLRNQLSMAVGAMLGNAATFAGRSAEVPRHPAVAALSEALSEKRYRDAAEVLKAYPLGILSQIGVEGLPSALPGLAASLVNPVLGAAVFAGSDAAIAYGGALLSSLESQGVDTSDPLAIQKALSDPDIRETAEKYASKWAIGSAAIGLATGGVGGKVVSDATRTVAKEVESVVARVAEAATKTGAKAAERESLEDAAKLAEGGAEAISGTSDDVAAVGKIASQAPGGDVGAHELLRAAQKDVLTEAQVIRRADERRGIVYIREKLPKNEAARRHQLETDGHRRGPTDDTADVPVILYDNPNPRGRPYVRMDAARVSEDGISLVIVDAKTQMALWSQGPRKTTLATLERVKRALEQNPEFKIVYELANEEAAAAAAEFLAKARLGNLISVFARKKP